MTEGGWFADGVGLDVCSLISRFWVGLDFGNLGEGFQVLVGDTARGCRLCPRLDFVHLGGVGEDVGELSVNYGWGFQLSGFNPDSVIFQ